MCDRGDAPFPQVSFAASMIGRPRRREQRGNRMDVNQGDERANRSFPQLSTGTGQSTR